MGVVSGVSFGARAERYARAVVAGEVVACKWVRLACERHLVDLARPASDDWPWTFDDERASRVCRFVEMLPHIKGRWARKRLLIKLEDWQVFVLAVPFGWVHHETRLRRFKRAYIEVPRKNAKSTLSCGVGLYMLTADGEPGAEVYSAATTGDQARIVFDVSRAMARRDLRFCATFGVDVQRHGLYVPDDEGKFEPLNAEGSTLDGLSPHCAIIDELHAHKRRDLYDVLDTATGARDQAMLWMITTAGSNRSGICYEQRTHVAKILDGVVHDETYFGIVYTLDEHDDWADPAVWAKANPNYGVSVLESDMEMAARKAMSMPSAKNAFLTKRLNVWVNADSAWMDMRAWDACADPALSIDDFEGAECIAALDLASKVDIAARVLLFEREGVYYVFGRYYLPERAVEDGRNSQYRGWVRSGRLTATPGNVTDYSVIEADLLEDAARYTLVEVPYDPFQATQLSTRMAEEGLPMVEMRPTTLNFSEPMKLLEALVLERKLRHDGDPVLAWMVSNVVCHRDAKDNIYPRKEREENKIDGLVALIMALGRALAARNAKQPKPKIIIL